MNIFNDFFDSDAYLKLRYIFLAFIGRR